MHEFGIARSICLAAAEAAEGKPVRSLVVEVGALAGVLVDALGFCVGEVAREEGLGEPEIIINETPAELVCKCGLRYQTHEMLDGCPECGGFKRDIITGLDITITKLETADASS